MRIEAAVIHPNPVRGAQVDLRVRLSGPADTLVARLYSPALVLLGERRFSGGFSRGWNGVRLDLDGVPSGLSYLSLRARQGNRESLPAAPLRLVRIP